MTLSVHRGIHISMVVALILLNFAVLALTESMGSAEALRFDAIAGAIPIEIVHATDVGLPDVVPPPFTLVTSLFVHGDIVHLLGNMACLFLCGFRVEKVSGSFRFLVLFLFTGILAGAAHCFSVPGSDSPLIGASGAVFGIMGAHFALYSRGRLLLVGWLVINVVSGAADVSWVAHVAGFIVGAGTAMLWAKPVENLQRRVIVIVRQPQVVS